MSKVPAIGPIDSDVVWVGEAPGKQEELDGKPFVGVSGQLFRGELRRAGFTEEVQFITNVCKTRPPYNDIEKFITKSKKGWRVSKEVAEGIRELFLEVAASRAAGGAKVVVPMGNVALWALTAEQGISKYRGSILSINWDLVRARALAEHGLLNETFLAALSASYGIKVIPTLHPAYVSRVYEERVLFSTDLKRIKEDSTFRELRLPERSILINPVGSDLEDVRHRLATASRISFDIETVGESVFCCGLSSHPSWAATFTWDDPAQKEFVKSFLAAPTPKIAQNGLYDVSFYQMYDQFVVKNYRYDSMVAMHVAYPELPKGLDTIGSIFTREPYYKDEGKNWSPRDVQDVMRFLTYNAKDVCVTQEAFDALDGDELKDPRFRATFDELMLNAVPAYIEMMVRGIRMDVPKMLAYRKLYTEQAHKFQDLLDRSVVQSLMDMRQSCINKGKTDRAKEVEDFVKRIVMPRTITRKKQKIQLGMGTENGALNVMSPKDMADYLYNFRGLPEKRHRKTKKVTTDENALKELYVEHGDADLLTILQIRAKRKRISSYLSVRTDSRGHTWFSINPVRTKTGRSGCGKTTTGYGNNKQTIPHELRDIYIPLPGYKFGYLDLSQAEARIVAYRGGVARMIYAFTHGIDLHKQTASIVLGVPMEGMQEFPHRYLGKKCNHAFNYEMGPLKFWTEITKESDETGVRITRSQAKAMRAAHFRVYPELELYWAGIRDELKRTRTLINPLGRKRLFLGRLDDDTFREGFSHYAQSTVIDVLRKGMHRVRTELCHPLIDEGYVDTFVQLDAHDALLLHYPEDKEKHFIPAATRMMEIPIPVGGQEIIIPVDAKVGWNWGEADKKDPTKNPRGLVKFVNVA